MGRELAEVNRALLITQIIGVPIVLAWFLYFYSQTHSPIAFVLIALLPVFAVLNIRLINRGRERRTAIRGFAEMFAHGYLALPSNNGPLWLRCAVWELGRRSGRAGQPGANERKRTLSRTGLERAFADTAGKAAVPKQVVRSASPAPRT